MYILRREQRQRLFPQMRSAAPQDFPILDEREIQILTSASPELNLGSQAR